MFIKVRFIVKFITPELQRTMILEETYTETGYFDYFVQFESPYTNTFIYWGKNQHRVFQVWVIDADLVSIKAPV